MKVYWIIVADVYVSKQKWIKCYVNRTLWVIECRFAHVYCDLFGNDHCYDFDTSFLLSLITLFVLQLDNIEWKVLRWVGTMLWFLWYHSNVTNLMLVNLLVYWNRLSPNWLFMRFSFKFGMHFFCLHSFVNPHNEWSQLWESNQIYINNTCNMKSGFSSEQSRIFHRIETNEMEWQLFLINVFFFIVFIS